MWVFQSCAVAWERVGHGPSYQQSVGCFATDVHQNFSCVRKERRGKARWLKRWEICKRNLTLATWTKSYSKEICLYQIKSIFSWTADLTRVTKPNHFLFLNSFYAVYVPSISAATHFQWLRFIGRWFDAKGSCTFQTCHHILLQAHSKCDGLLQPRGAPLGLRQRMASKKWHPPSSIYLRIVKLTVLVVLLIRSRKTSVIVQSTWSIFWMEKKPRNFYFVTKDAFKSLLVTLGCQLYNRFAKVEYPFFCLSFLNCRLIESVYMKLQLLYEHSYVLWCFHGSHTWNMYPTYNTQKLIILKMHLFENAKIRTKAYS